MAITGILLVIFLITALINVMNSGMEESVTSRQYTMAKNERMYGFWDLDHWSNKPPPYNLFFFSIQVLKWIIQRLCCTRVSENCTDGIFTHFFSAEKEKFIDVTTVEPEAIYEASKEIAIAHLKNEDVLCELDFQGNSIFHELVSSSDYELLSKILSEEAINIMDSHEKMRFPIHNLRNVRNKDNIDAMLNLFRTYIASENLRFF